MSKSKAELMRESRERKREAGLVRIERWVPADKKEQIEEKLDRIIAKS